MNTITTTITDNENYIICSSCILVNEGIINKRIYKSLVTRILNYQYTLFHMSDDKYIDDVLRFINDQEGIKSSVLYRVNKKLRICISCSVLKEQHVEIVLTYKK